MASGKDNVSFFKSINLRLSMDILLVILIMLLLWFWIPVWTVVLAYIFSFPYLFLTKRRNLLFHLLLASFIAVVWLLIARHEYGYNWVFPVIAGINLYPLFAWAIGLFGVYLLFSHYSHNASTYLSKLFLFIITYWPLLIAAEWLAFYVWGIHNVATDMYPGLPICNCMHAPHWMQFAYFIIGPIYFSICYLFGLEARSRSKRSKKYNR